MRFTVFVSHFTPASSSSSVPLLLSRRRTRFSEGNASPNQGIKLSRRNSLTLFLISLLIFGLAGGLIGGLGRKLIVGLLIGLNRGGSAVIKHYALRLILWLNGDTPLNFVKFLHQCSKLIFLKKVGGGYIFIHGMFRDYFADLTPPAT